MNQQEELILKILSSVESIQGKTKFVKILHFCCKLLEKHKKESPFVFRPDNYGVYPPSMEPVLEKLESQRLIKISSPLFSRRNDLSLMDRAFQFNDQDIIELGPSN